MSSKLTKVLIERPITVNDPEDHLIIVKRGFLTAFIFSILYGFYEYFVVYHYIRIYDILGPSGNWSIMYLSLVLCVAITTRYEGKLNVEQIIMGLFFMAMFEDVIYWMSQWIDLGIYPFPAGNWWDNMFPSFRVLGGLGQPIPFWPFVPTYYLPGFGLVFGFYICSFRGPKLSRIAFMIIGPLFIAILIGTLWNDIFAIFVLITIPAICYLFEVFLLSRIKWKFIEN